MKKLTNLKNFDESIELYKNKIKILEKKKIQARQEALLEFSNFIFTNIKENENFKKNIESAFKELGEESLEYLYTFINKDNKKIKGNKNAE